MIKPTRKERVLRFFAHPLAQSTFDILCNHNEDWQVGPNRVFTRSHQTVIEFDPGLKNFRLVQPFRNRLGFFGSLLFRSVVTRIRLNHLTTKSK